MVPKIELAQSILQIFKQREIEHIVISPGSRNAPLTIGFTNDSFFKCYSIADERCAGFFALGIAQQLHKPVVVVCTSGSALLNYYPSFAEAFYSQIPLIVISADRPISKIDIGDGQTIRQQNVFQNHSLANINLPEIPSSASDMMIHNGIIECLAKKGPIHINVPFEEPLYEILQNYTYKAALDFFELHSTTYEIPNYILETWQKAEKKLILIGDLPPNSIEEKFIETIAKDPTIVVLKEKSSNVHHPSFIDRIDTLITPFTKEDKKLFQPDILLSIGGMIVSKRIKSLLREFQPKHHFHVDPIRAYNTYGCLSEHVCLNANDFFSLATFNSKTYQYKKSIQTIWESRLNKHKVYTEKITFSDFKVFHFISQNLPPNIHLQISNSSAIRYIQLFDISKSIEVYCNRGTSGIDGSTSTAIGAAQINAKPTFFITGDISFFYDNNALWNNYIPKNFKIVLINNSGGGIFRILPGHQENETFNTFFETSHQLNASHLAKMHQLNYFEANNEKELENIWKLFILKNDSPSILEIFTPEKVNDKILLDYFTKI